MTPPSSERSLSQLAPEELFEELLRACRLESQTRLDALKPYWERVVRHVRNCDPDSIRLNERERIQLIIWLTTRPDPNAAPRPEPLPSRMLEERQQHLEMVNQALHKWMERDYLIGKLEQFDKAWGDKATAILAKVETPRGDAKNLEAFAEQLVDVCSMIGSRLEQFVLDSDISLFGARIGVELSEGKVRFVINDEILPLRQVIRTVKSMTGLSKEMAAALTEAAVLSLPVFVDLLPTFSAEPIDGALWLDSTSVNPIDIATQETAML